MSVGRSAFTEKHGLFVNRSAWAAIGLVMKATTSEGTFGWKSGVKKILGLAVAGSVMLGLFGGCEAVSEPVDDAERNALTREQREELLVLGIADAVPEGNMHILLDVEGDEIGVVSQIGPRVEVGIGDEIAVLGRRDASLSVQCSSMAEPEVLDTPGVLSDWLADSELEPECIRVIEAARIVTAIDTAHAPGCTLEEVDGVERLACDTDDQTEFRNLGLGCECAGDGWGFCPASCWSCDGGYNPVCEDGGDGGGGGGGGDGGGGGGGGDLGCSAYNKTFTRTRGGTVIFGEDFTGFCSAAESAARSACTSSSGWVCKASVSSTTFVEGECGAVDFETNTRYCSCKYSADCVYALGW